MCDTIVMATAETEMGLDPGKARGSNMCRSLSKYAPVFLVLALSGLIFLLRNIHTLEVSVCDTVQTIMVRFLNKSLITSERRICWMMASHET